MQTGLCAVLLFLGADSETHTASFTPLTPSLDTTQHTNEPNTDTAHGTNNNEVTMANEKWIGTKGKKWDNTAAPTH